MRIVPTEEIEKIISRIPKEPEGTEEWIIDHCVKQGFIIYNISEDWAVCTKCGAVLPEAEPYKGGHGERGKCPYCNKEAILLSSGRGREKYTQYFRVLMFGRRGKTVYGTLWEFDAVIKDPGRPKLERWLSAIYIIDSKQRHYYKNHGYEWREYNTFKMPAPWSSPNNWCMPKYGDTYVKANNIRSVFEKSDLKYLVTPLLAEIMWKEYLLVKYIQYGMMHQSIELLAKSGFTWLVVDKIQGDEISRAVNWRGKNLEKILRLPKRYIRKLRKINPDTEELYLFQNLTEQEKQIISVDMLVDLKRSTRYVGLEEYRKKVETHTPFTKWMKYIENQLKENGLPDCDMWFDYLDMCRDLGMDIRRKRVLFPENLRTEHDGLVMKIAAKENKKLDRKIRKRIRKESYKDENLLIKPAASQGDLNVESGTLNHCVKMYGDKIASGKCWIWFIRKVEDPDTPFYTMETDTDGHMIQCRGKSNCSMTEEVRAFAEGFEHHLQKELEKERATA